MKINSNNIIEFLILKFPILLEAPGFEDTDKESPYVAFGMFIPFLIAEKKTLPNFLQVVSDVYNETEDEEVINLISVEIFENFHRLGKDNIVDNSSGKMRNDFTDYLKSFSRS